MVTISYRNNLVSENKIVSDSMTPAEFISTYGIEVGGRSLALSGRTLTTDEWDKSFAELGVTTSASLLAIARKDNA